LNPKGYQRLIVFNSAVLKALEHLVVMDKLGLSVINMAAKMEI
jgi:hypothetical protein